MSDVTDNEARSRFELGLEGGTAFVDYYRMGTVRVLTHAEVPSALRGRGVGARLVAAVLDLIRARHERVVPRCGFVVRFMERHPEYDDLLASRQRAPLVTPSEPQ